MLDIHIVAVIPRDAYNAYLWLRENENKFEKKVYGPIALEVSCPCINECSGDNVSFGAHQVTVTNSLHARYLEMITPTWLMGAFVCQTSILTFLVLKAMKC